MKYFIFILCLICQQAKSQYFKIGFATGIGNYTMTDLKDINSIATVDIPFNTRLVSDFPPYLFYKPSFLMEYKNYTIGFLYSFQSTGSRISGIDYSGEYRFDIKVNSNNIGLHNEMNLLVKSKFQVSIFTDFGFSYSNLKMYGYLLVLDSFKNNDYNNFRFRSKNYFVEPGINFKYPFKSFYANLSLGYWIQFGDESFHASLIYGKVYLVNQQKLTPVKPNWNGYRIGLGFFYYIKT